MVHRILIVEDDRDTQTATAELVAGLGCVPVPVCDGAEAIRWLDANPVPSLVLLDMFLPVASGREVLAFLTHQPRLAHVPVVVVTAGYGVDAFRRVAAVLQKPCAPATLCRTVLAHLRRPLESEVA